MLVVKVVLVVALEIAVEEEDLVVLASSSTWAASILSSFSLKSARIDVKSAESDPLMVDLAP